MSFEPFHLHRHVLVGVRDAGYVTPTPIQLQAIPPVLDGRDVMGLAQTGTGKTAAFALPMLHRLLPGPRGPVRALVIAPTRELVEQINDAFTVLGRHTGLTSTVVYGGVGINPQINALRGGIDIVVACPGRLLDHLCRRTISLSRVEVLVLDEADRMLDMGFLPDVRKILKHLPSARQTLLFSATMPDEVRGLAHDVLRAPVTVQVDHNKPASCVSHALYPVDHHLKTPLLLELLRQDGTESIIIFTRTKHRAKKVARHLEQAGHQATSLQGNLSQNKRQSSINGFRRGAFKIMVATDIASRGIDVTKISHVINYDMPDTVDAYTHRIGRTGRLSRAGDAFTLVTREDEEMVRGIERILGEKLERRTIEGFDYRAPAPPKESGTAGRQRPPQRRQTATPRPAPRPAAATPRHRGADRRATPAAAAPKHHPAERRGASAPVSMVHHVGGRPHRRPGETTRRNQPAGKSFPAGRPAVSHLRRPEPSGEARRENQSPQVKNAERPTILKRLFRGLRANDEVHAMDRKGENQWRK